MTEPPRPSARERSARSGDPDRDGAPRARPAPRIRPRVVEALPERGRRHEEEPEAPTVRVVIGRIDVRAVPEAPHPARAGSAPRKPRLALDEYLRQRTKGER
jgi:hypothetical protein